jgi:hypothetical protein
MKPAVGLVYVLSNEAMPDLLNIGYTMNTVEGRVKATWASAVRRCLSCFTKNGY